MKTQRGYTLIELMISLVIGLVALAAVTSVFISMLGTNTTQMKTIRLNQELRGAMTNIVRDLRRSGFNAYAAQQLGPPIASFGFSQLTLGGIAPVDGSAQSTVNFAYDATYATYDPASPTIEVETFGYQLNNGAIRACKDTVSTCSNWERITDDSLVNISALTFLPKITSVGGLNHTTITVTLTGNLIADTNFTRTLVQTVVLRNPGLVP